MLHTVHIHMCICSVCVVHRACHDSLAMCIHTVYVLHSHNNIYIYDMYTALAEFFLRKMWERGGVDGGSWGVYIYIVQPIASGGQCNPHFQSQSYGSLFNGTRQKRPICIVQPIASGGEVGGWGRDPKKCTGSIWGMGSSNI